jgi:hypothetical protein
VLVLVASSLALMSILLAARSPDGLPHHGTNHYQHLLHIAIASTPACRMAALQWLA